MFGAWWRKNVIEQVHAAAYSGRFTIKVSHGLSAAKPHLRLLGPCVITHNGSMMARAVKGATQDD